MIHLEPRQRYSASEVRDVKAALKVAQEIGLIEERRPSGHMDVVYRGVMGGPVSHKWNVVVYKQGRVVEVGASIVCVDFFVLDKIVNHGCMGLTTSRKPAIIIDDAGWGFPLCGVMVGASDGKSVLVDVVPPLFFSDDPHSGFATKMYLTDFASRGEALVRKFGATPKTHRIEICTGYVNSTLRDSLRGRGFETKGGEVTGLLQDELEERFRQYVKAELGTDCYYDPKGMEKGKVSSGYGTVLEWGQRNRPDLCKSGWRALGGRGASW